MNMNPLLASLVADFAATGVITDPDGYPDEATYAVAELRDANTAYGLCGVVSEAFAAYLNEHGIDAVVVETDDSREWGFPLNWNGRRENHCAVVADGLLIDWTAEQFASQPSFPRVTTWQGQ